MIDLSKELIYIKPIYIGPNPKDRKIFMIDYDNKGYRGGTDSFKCEVKLNKDVDKDDIFEVFLDNLYKFNYNDSPIFFRKEHNKPKSKYLYELMSSAIDFLGDNGQIGPATFIIVNEDYLKDKKISELVNTIDNVIFYDKDDIIIGRKNTNPNTEPGLYLSYSSDDKFSVDIIGHRAKNQYLILKIKK